MSGALTSSTFSGYWSLAADGPRGSFRLDVKSIQNDVSGDARSVRLRGEFLDRQAGTVADSMQLRLANDGSVLGSGCSDFGDYAVVGTHANNTLSLRKTPLLETCVVLHARRCRSPTCPISACARRRLQDAQAAAAAPAPARLPPPAAAERATTSGSYAPGPQSHLFR